MKGLSFKILKIIAKIGFLFAVVNTNFISANHMYEIKQPMDLKNKKIGCDTNDNIKTVLKK